jgi:Protein of unknown function (DUF2842)
MIPKSGNRLSDKIMRKIARRASMRIRTRKLIGTFALLALASVWALLAMALAQSVLTDINGFVAAIFYVVAGLGWVLPAMPLVSWMVKPDAPRP